MITSSDLHINEASSFKCYLQLEAGRRRLTCHWSMTISPLCIELLMRVTLDFINRDWRALASYIFFCAKDATLGVL